MLEQEKEEKDERGRETRERDQDSKDKWKGIHNLSLFAKGMAGKRDQSSVPLITRRWAEEEEEGRKGWERGRK